MSEHETWTWCKSSLSVSGDCVEWALDSDRMHILVRHSRDPLGPRLRFTLSEWQAFVDATRLGEADF
jgi:hypothetical protein